jgi:hypothetical protein
LLVVEVPTAVPPSTDAIIRRINEGLLTRVFPGLEVDVTKTRQVRLPVGPAVEVDVIAQGHRGTMVFIPMVGESVDMVFLSGGSVKAQTDFPRMLDSLRVS